ncbi:hypothetical protein [Ferrimicrobium acidiphilum]|uniref:hypothetical protein n=1 Tax=Ferrimicrobium acidiphilum TaxID=121039 RepID=UPI0023F470C6|nr:hypothetical protein [Ferrimicrobium acidiphilum]
MAGSSGNYGDSLGGEEGFPFSISAVTIGGPTFLATQSNPPIEIALLVFSIFGKNSARA